MFCNKSKTYIKPIKNKGLPNFYVKQPIILLDVLHLFYNLMATRLINLWLALARESNGSNRALFQKYNNGCRDIES